MGFEDIDLVGINLAGEDLTNAEDGKQYREDKVACFEDIFMILPATTSTPQGWPGCADAPGRPTGRN